MVRRNISVLGLLWVLIGCAGSGADEAECVRGSECASGVCSDGRCYTPSGGAGGGAGLAGAGGASAGAGGGGAAGSGSGGAAAGGSGGTTTCLPNQDGQIERSEVPLAAGLNAKFLVAQNATFATSGTTAGDGSRVWDLTVALAGDHLALVETQPLAGKWFASSFSGASYATELAEGSDLLGVFEITGQALLLRGVVSPTGGATRTELSYSPPVVVLDFPLTKSKSWATTSTVSGVAQGIAAFYTEKYETTVDSDGTLKTPFSDFGVLRTQTMLTRTVGLLVTTLRSFAFTTECFGTVATVRSKDNEPSVEFSQVAEVRRLSP